MTQQHHLNHATWDCKYHVVSRTANSHGIVPSARAGIVINVDIGGACNGKPDTEPVSFTMCESRTPSKVVWIVESMAYPYC